MSTFSDISRNDAGHRFSIGETSPQGRQYSGGSLEKNAFLPSMAQPQETFLFDYEDTTHVSSPRKVNSHRGAKRTQAVIIDLFQEMEVLNEAKENGILLHEELMEEAYPDSMIDPGDPAKRISIRVPDMNGVDGLMKAVMFTALSDGCSGETIKPIIELIGKLDEKWDAELYLEKLDLGRRCSVSKVQEGQVRRRAREKDRERSFEEVEWVLSLPPGRSEVRSVSLNSLLALV